MKKKKEEKTKNGQMNANKVVKTDRRWILKERLKEIQCFANRLLIQRGSGLWQVYYGWGRVRMSPTVCLLATSSGYDNFDINDSVNYTFKRKKKKIPVKIKGRKTSQTARKHLLKGHVRYFDVPSAFNWKF